MVRDVSDSMFDDILANGGSQYFFHKMDTGLVEVVFKSSIRQVKPGEEDSAGRKWNPKLTDANGNPVLDRNGNPREPWTKYEAEVTIKGVPYIYSFSGERSSILRSFIAALRNEDIRSKDLPGTKWSFERIGQFDWRIKYLGKENSPSPSPKEKEPLSEDMIKIKNALSIKRDQSANGVPKGDFLSFLAFVTHKKSDDLKGMLPQLVSIGMIKEENNLIYIL